MAFSKSVVDKAFGRARSRCECTGSGHGHIGRCAEFLTRTSRGREGVGGWEAHYMPRVESSGADTLANCEILCSDCHKATF